MGLSRLTIAFKRSSSMILAVPLAREGADEDQVLLVTTSTPEMRGGTYRVTGFRRPDCPMAG
jgi:hypothetical protein